MQRHPGLWTPVHGPRSQLTQRRPDPLPASPPVLTGTIRPRRLAGIAAGILVLVIAPPAMAHGVSGAEARFLAGAEGVRFSAYLYLGARHMVTGYDHLLFLLGVVFYLGSLRRVALYVSLFALGHSITLITGVLADIHVNAHLVDAVIGLSVVYKAFDNLGGMDKLFGVRANNRSAVFVFGLFHGFGLATRLQEITLSPDGLLVNLLAFNVGVELGQVLALLYLLLLLEAGKRMGKSPIWGIGVNMVLMTGGFALTSYQLAWYLAA